MSKLNKEQLFEVIRTIAEQNLLTFEEVTHVLEEAIKKAFYNKYDPDAQLELLIDQEHNQFALINHSKFVIKDSEYNPEYRAIEIALKDAKKIDKNIKVGQTISEEVDFTLYSRAIALQIKQMLTQSVKEKKKEAVFAKHKSLKGEMIDVVVSSISPSFVIFALEDGTTAFMPGKLRNPNVKLAVGQRTKVFVEDVVKESRDSQIIVSNGSKEVVKRVLEMEVPEIADGNVEIVKIARIPGVRSKVAVRATNESIDPVGAIIGEGGKRISAIIKKLEGEKIDVISYSDNINEFIANALAPAKIVSVIDKFNDDGSVKTDHKVVIAPNVQQTLAIGKGGTNVRLAVELTSTRIDLISVDQAHEKGIEIDFNVGLSASDLQTIESGQRVARKRNNNFQNTPEIDKFDSSIEDFTTAIEEADDARDQDIDVNEFDIDEDLFSEEDLKSMQDNFEYDDEIDDFDEKKK